MSEKKATSEYQIILTVPTWQEYELLDSGSHRKLERFGDVILDRPEPQAIWLPQDVRMWQDANASYIARGGSSNPWHIRRPIPYNWRLQYNHDLKFRLKLTSSKHVGVFPEQSGQWEGTASLVAAADRPVEVLNLFGYTGAATLKLARAGAKVTHVDASYPSIEWAKENQACSGLEDKPIRWILDDVKKFIARELRRGKKYDGIIIDPPSFGRGPKGEIWKLQEDLANLVTDIIKSLSKDPLFVLLNSYSLRMSAFTLANLLTILRKDFAGILQSGETGLLEKTTGRVLSQSIYALWRNT